ncbi:MAG TPA: hypothetical protein VFU59_06445 [Candidatus Eisenbacteria bacterium]|nr:hypothetical protein [Candidatus Eisenbacteria bacterium]
MKRFVSLLLVVLVGLPWSAVPAARATACAMPGAKAIETCSYCAPPAPTSNAGARLEAGCCRFAPNQEATPAQAGSIVSSPKPLQALPIATLEPGRSASDSPLLAATRAIVPPYSAPPPVSPTRTTHLLV